MSPFSLKTWVSWIVATAVAAVTMTVSTVVFSYSTFTTKEETNRLEKKVDEQKTDINDRLKTIESKIDALLMARGVKPLYR